MRTNTLDSDIFDEGKSNDATASGPADERTRRRTDGRTRQKENVLPKNALQKSIPLQKGGAEDPSRPQPWSRECVEFELVWSSYLSASLGDSIQLTIVPKSGPVTKTTICTVFPRPPAAVQPNKEKPSTCLPICLRPGGRVSLCLVAPPQAAAEYCITGQIVVFVGGPLLETIVPLGGQ